MRLVATLARPLAALVILGSTVAAQDAAVTKFTADFGYVNVSGNTSVTSLSVGDKFTWARERWSFEQTFGIVRGEQDGVENTNNLREIGRAHV